MSKHSFIKSARDYVEDVRDQRRDGNTFAAERLLNEGLRHYPDNAYLMVYQGNLYRDTRRDGEAMDAFRRAFVRHPKEQIAVMGFANFLTLKHEFETAENVYAHMFSLNGPRDMRLLTALGNMYQVAGKMPLAAACFGKAVLLPNTDEYAQRRYKEICNIFTPGFLHEEWKNVEARMTERKGSALEVHRLAAEASAPRNPPDAVDPADQDQPVYNGPAWS